MERIISHIREYSFNGDIPPIPAEENLFLEQFYNQQGLLIKQIFNNKTMEYNYEANTNLLLREVIDCRDGKREVSSYTYDDDSNLICCHHEEQLAYDGYGQIMHLPTGYYSDELFDWSNDGKTCTRTTENHYEDGTVSKELTRDEFDDHESRQRSYHYDETFRHECFNSLFYQYPGGPLILIVDRSVFTTKEGNHRVIITFYRYADERLISEESHGENAFGEMFNTEILYEYEDDEEGNWVVQRQRNKNGKVQYTVIREIEYW